MIPFNAALVAAFWERPLALRLEQRRVAGPVLHSEQRLVGQRGYLGVASTPPPPPGTYYGYPAYGSPAYGYPPYGYPGYGYRAYPQPGYGYPGYSGYPAHSGASGYGYQAYSAQPPYPGPPAYGSSSNSGYPAYLEPPAYGHQSRALDSPDPGFGNGSPGYGFPADRPSEHWAPGDQYGIEPSS